MSSRGGVGEGRGNNVELPSREWVLKCVEYGKHISQGTAAAALPAAPASSPLGHCCRCAVGHGAVFPQVLLLGTRPQPSNSRRPSLQPPVRHLVGPRFPLPAAGHVTNVL